MHFFKILLGGHVVNAFHHILKFQQIIHFLSFLHIFWKRIARWFDIISMAEILGINVDVCIDA